MSFACCCQKAGRTGFLLNMIQACKSQNNPRCSNFEKYVCGCRHGFLMFFSEWEKRATKFCLEALKPMASPNSVAHGNAPRFFDWLALGAESIGQIGMGVRGPCVKKNSSNHISHGISEAKFDQPQRSWALSVPPHLGGNRSHSHWRQQTIGKPQVWRLTSHKSQTYRTKRLLQQILQPAYSLQCSMAVMLFFWMVCPKKKFKLADLASGTITYIPLITKKI